MIHQLYKKQVEAWKERFQDYLKEQWSHSAKRKLEDILSSRHKDTIELIEAEIERKRGMRKEETRAVRKSGDWDLAIGYNSAIDEDIAYLEEQLALIKKEI